MNDTGRHPNIWLRFLFIWALILLILGAIGCFVLYRYLEVYEVTRPEPIMDSLITETDVEALIDQARENVHLDLTEFEDPSALYDSYISATDTTRSLSYRLNSSQSTEDSLVYTVRSGPSPLCDVVLVPDGNSPGFDRHFWQISEIRAANIIERLPSVNVSVSAISGTEVYLNGHLLTDTEITTTQEPITDLTRFESDLVPPLSYTRYEVGPLYGEVTVSDAHGNTVNPDGEVSNGELAYHLFTETQSLSIRAPEDMTVLVNGVEVSKNEVVSSSLGVLSGLDLYTQNAACLTNVYRINGLYRTPEVQVFDETGNEVTPVAAAENSFTYFHPGEPETEESMRIVAENYFNAYMDYSSHAFEATRFSNLLTKILPGSSLYEYVFNSREAMYWASGTSTEYNDLRYENFHQISDYCFVCTVIYSADMTATNWYEQYSYALENAYELSFVSENGRWLAAGMDVITQA